MLWFDLPTSKDKLESRFQAKQGVWRIREVMGGTTPQIRRSGVNPAHLIGQVAIDPLSCNKAERWEGEQGDSAWGKPI